MKRNLSLIREILLSIESSETRDQPPDVNIEGFSEEEIDYNLDLLIQAHLINGTGYSSIDGTYYANIKGLTWHGHDFLDSVRNESVWAKTQEKAEKGGHTITNLTFDVIKALASSIIKEQLGI